MAAQVSVKFINDTGLKEIRIGVREFECMGASRPHDHPHIYLDMGQKSRIRCPYCGTLYVFDHTLKAHEAEPQACLVTTG
jgi:uncharacterized Zn-finger protein